VQSFERPSEGEPFNIEYPKATLSEYALELAAFADYVTDEKDGSTDAVSEQRSTAIIQAGYESAEHGRPVNLQELFGDL
jgi:predicted dehydrogenase